MCLTSKMLIIYLAHPQYPIRDILVIRSRIKKHVHSAWIQLIIIVMCIHSLSSFRAFEPVSISANKDIFILLLLAQMKRMLQTWDVIVHDVSNSCCG